MAESDKGLVVLRFLFALVFLEKFLPFSSAFNNFFTSEFALYAG